MKKRSPHEEKVQAELNTALANAIGGLVMGTVWMLLLGPLLIALIVWLCVQ